MEERILIDQLRSKQESAFRWLVEEYRNRVYYSAFNILQNSEDAEDAAQETFIQVYDSIGSFKEEASLSTWIYKIAIRKALEKLRKRKNRQRLHQWIPWWMPNEKASEQAIELNPGISAENKEKAFALFSSINSLPENQRIAFTLIRVQGLKYEEVCAIMDLKVKAVESLVSRAKETLKKKLDTYYEK